MSDCPDPLIWLKRIQHTTVILECLARLAEVIAIYHINHRGTLKQNKVQYHFTKFGRLELLLPFRFNVYVKKLRPDVVIVHGLISPWQIIMLRWQLGNSAKIMVQHHAERPLRDIRQYFQRWADRYIYAYLFCSYDLGKQWIDAGQIKDQSKIKEVMEVSSLFYLIKKEEAKLITKVPEHLVFLWVGRLLPMKDPLLVVRTFAHFTKLNSSAKLYMIYQSDELLDDVARVINKLDAQDSISLIGRVEHSEMLYWYNSADFIISTSHYEGSGTAICEAMSCGCIPILPSIPSFKMMTENGKCGLLFTSKDSTDLGKTLIRCSQLNLQQEKQKVLIRYSDKLSPEATAKDIYDVIVSL